MRIEQMVVKTLAGFEEELAKEIKEKLGLDSTLGVRSVIVEGDQFDMYQINLKIGLALRVLVPLFKFKAFNERQIYKAVSNHPWEDLMSKDDTFVIDATIISKFFKHNQYASLRMKDAIVDRFKEKFGDRPNIDKVRPTYRLHLYINDNEAQVLLDSSGSSLHLRGYKTNTHPAPLNEVLAHGIIKRTNYEEHDVIVDPMCGSGTLLIEAAMLKYNMAPNKFRPWFGFESWKNFDASMWNHIKEKAVEAEVDSDVKLYGFDFSDRSVNITKEHFENIGLQDRVELKKMDFFRSERIAEKGMVIMNPPYDERMPLEEDAAFYSQIGDTLKQSYTDWDAWIFTANLPALKRVGLKASRKIPMLNAKLESRLVHFQMYRGTKKVKSE